MKVLVLGNGQIGNFYLRYFREQGHEVQIPRLDITDPAAVEDALLAHAPDVVINTAAATNLEWCGANRLAAFEVNVLGASHVAAACDRHGIRLVHLSSGCVFSSLDGADAKTEQSTPNPSSYYGWTKVWSEQIVTFERSPDFPVLVLRPRQPVSAQLSPKNMLVKMLTFSKFVDTPNSGTVIEDLMRWTHELIDARATGIYHVANSGYTTPFEIGTMLARDVLPGLHPEKIEKRELDAMTPNHRVDTVLDVTKLESLGISVAPYRQRLDDVVTELAANVRDTDVRELEAVLEATAAVSAQRTVLNDVYRTLYAA